MPPKFPRDIQRTVLRDTPNLGRLYLRDYHPLWCTIPGNFGIPSQVFLGAL